MVKRVLMAMLNLGMVISLAACSGDLPQNQNEPIDSIAESTETTQVVTETEAQSEIVEVKEETAFERIARKMAESDEYLIFSIGDSLTEGQGASDDLNAYTAVFAKRLAERFSEKQIVFCAGKRNATSTGLIYPLRGMNIQKGTEGKITVVRSGIGGNTVQRIINRKDDFVSKEIEGKYGDLFIISVGINDSVIEDSSKYASPPKYKSNLSKLVDMIKEAHPEADIILMTPTWRDSGTEKKSYLEQYSMAMKNLAKEKDIPVIDMHQMWMDHLVVGSANYGQREWLNDGKDNCHPSDAGHAAMADEMMRCIFGDE